jgi:hypothetical protein
MLGNIFFIVAVVGVFLTLDRVQARFAPADDREVCWSCGMRNQHKLWCPNR